MEKLKLNKETIANLEIKSEEEKNTMLYRHGFTPELTSGC